MSPLKAKINDLKAENSNLKEQIQLRQYDCNLFHNQMQKQVKENLALEKVNESEKKEKEELKKEIEKLKIENEELKKKNETLIPDKNRNILESSESQIMLSPRSPSIDTPPPLLEPQLTQTPTQQDISTDRVRQYFRDQSPEIPEPMIVSDSESDDDNEVSDVKFTPNSVNQERNEKVRRKSQMKAKEMAKKLMDRVLGLSEPWRCRICSSSFATSAELRQHMLADHKNQKYFCKRCPLTGTKSSDVKKHEQKHFRNDVDCKNKPECGDCKLCKIWLPTNGRLYQHLRKYHLPKKSSAKTCKL